MIEFLVALLRESPALFTVLVANLLIIAYIVIRISLYFGRRKHPGKTISGIFWRMKAKRARKEIKTIEDVYSLVMEGLRKEGFLGKEDAPGFRARKKILDSIPEGEKRTVLQELFTLYEAKVYGKRGIRNEKDVASDIHGKYTGL